MSGRLRIVGVLVVALLLAGGGFAAGMTLGPGLKGEPAATANGSTRGNGQFVLRPGASGAPQGGAQLQQVSGKVISVNDGSITIETQRPGASATTSTIALVGADTRVVRTTETQIALSDLRPGDQVLVVGTPDAATGTVSANAVVVGVSALQQLFGGFGGRGGAGRAGASPSAQP